MKVPGFFLAFTVMCLFPKFELGTIHESVTLRYNDFGDLELRML